MDERTRPIELPVDPDAENIGLTRPLHFRPEHIGVVALGAFVGTLARYTVGRGWPVGDEAFPSSTFVINVVGAFALGVLLEALVRRGDDSGWRRRARLLAGTGFCGGFTTYSTLATQTDLLVRAHHLVMGATYALASVLVGLVSTAAGMVGASAHHRRRQHRLPLDPDLVAEATR